MKGLNDEQRDECPGTGGVVYAYEGPQFGAQMVEEPCEVCNGWHESPADRSEREAYEHWLANPGLIRRLWRRIARGAAA